MGKYKGDGNTGEQVYINGLTGSPIVFHRQGNGQSEDNEIRINNPSINMLLFVQPDKINDLISKATLKDSGLLARLLIYPGNTDIAHMLDEQYDEPEFDDKKAAEFRCVFYRLADLWEPGTITKVVLSDEAKRARVDAMKWLGTRTAGH